MVRVILLAFKKRVMDFYFYTVKGFETVLMMTTG